MLSINLTLLVQVINFLITWFLLDRIFIREGYAVVLKEKSLESDLLREQQALSEVLNERIATHEQLIQVEQLHLTQEMPSYGGKKVAPHYDIKEIVRVELEPGEHQKLVRLCTDRMVERILTAGKSRD